MIASIVGCLLVGRGAVAGGRRSPEGESQSRGHPMVSAALGASSPEAPVGLSLARRQSPGARASRQGGLSFFFASSVRKMQRTCISCNGSDEECNPRAVAVRYQSTLCGLGPGDPGNPAVRATILDRVALNLPDALMAPFATAKTTHPCPGPGRPSWGWLVDRARRTAPERCRPPRWEEVHMEGDADGMGEGRWPAIRRSCYLICDICGPLVAT